MNTHSNPELQLVHDFVEHTDRNIFLTGKAGTGKTTFLHNLKKSTQKRMIVTAPTGVAAINAGGVTLHSFFQLPFGPFVPGSEAYGRRNQHRFSREKKNIIKSLDLLVIDEISMVRADLLDSVDGVLRRHRRNDLPFGGVQLLMIGDLQQLSPVVKEDDWAITIHKSQGLTFDRAVIDAGAAFVHGQVYVALSRCKTFEGLVLSSPIPAHAIKTDEAVSRFNLQTSRTPPSREKLEASRVLYQQRLLSECFDFAKLHSLLGRLLRVLCAKAGTIRVSGPGDLQELEDKAGAEIFVVSEKFRMQLTGLFAGDKLPEADPAVFDRVTKAGAYFEEKLDSILGDGFTTLRIDTDNKEIAKIANGALDELKKETALKLAAVRSCKPGFSPARYLRALSSAETDSKPDKERKSRSAEYTVSEVGHPELFQALKDWRAAKAGEADDPHYRILHQSVLIRIAAAMPDTPAALMGIKGIGKRLFEKYGKELLALVSSYRQKHRLSEPARPGCDGCSQISRRDWEGRSNRYEASYLRAVQQGVERCSGGAGARPGPFDHRRPSGRFCGNRPDRYQKAA